MNPEVFGPEANNENTLKRKRVGLRAYQIALADQLKDLACSGREDDPFIVRGLILNRRIEFTGMHAPKLVKAIQASDCPASTTLSEDDKASLKKIAIRAKAKTPGVDYEHLSLP